MLPRRKSSRHGDVRKHARNPHVHVLRELNVLCKRVISANRDHCRGKAQHEQKTRWHAQQYIILVVTDVGHFTSDPHMCWSCLPRAQPRDKTRRLLLTLHLTVLMS